MNSWDGRGSAGPGLVGCAPDGRVGLSTELEDALASVRSLGRSVVTAQSHERRASDLKEIICEARRALVLSASLASASETPSGIVARSSTARSAAGGPLTPSEWLLRSVVHDLNNMLLVIQNCTESLRHQECPSVQREARVVQDAVTQATRLVAKLMPSELGFGRPFGMDLSECVGRFSGVIGSLVGEPVTVVTRLSAGLPPVRGEETAILRVLSNLATNARDAMPSGGTLSLETRPAESRPRTQPPEGTPRSYVLLSVVDTGSGMDAATKGKAFEPFFTTKPPGKGTGVGLTAVREIVQSMGGCVDIESEPGRGTTVSIYLECAEPPA